MKNFTFCNPTKLIFGEGTISKLAQEIPAGSRVLFLFGGGSIKKNGVYDEVKKGLSSFSVFEFSGIEANPEYETCLKAVALVKKESIDFILGVGGGSVGDAAKFIAAAPFHKDPWSILETRGSNVSEMLPVGIVLTLPATGTEMNGASVISRRETQAKQPFIHPSAFPKFSILDPQKTCSLPERQTVNGVIDTYVHTIEQYLCDGTYSPLQSRLSESILLTLRELGPALLANPEDYELRANMMWTATMALNGVIGVGVEQDWVSHAIGHELTALYGLDHGVTLAIVLPRVLDFNRETKHNKLLQYAQRIFSLSIENPQRAVDNVIAATENYFQGLGVKTKLSEHGIDPKEAAEKISNRFLERGFSGGERGNLGGKEIKEILLKC